MADYKDIVNDVIGRANTIAEETGVKEVYADGLSRAKSYAKIARLTFDINRENEELRRVFTEIGKLFYEQAEGKAEGFYASLFSRVEEIRGVIADREAEIDGIRNEIAERSRAASKAAEPKEAEESAEDIEVEICDLDATPDFPAEE